MTTRTANAVTVGVPVYNGEQYLKECLESLLRQTRQPDIVTVWDNASTDRSVQVAGSLVGRGNVQVRTTNDGAIANFERAAAAASTEWFMWLAADDRLAPRYIEVCLQHADRDRASRPAVLTSIQFIDAASEPLRIQRDGPLGAMSVDCRARHFLRKGRWTETYCLYRTEALRRSPGFTVGDAPDVLLTWWFILRSPLLIVDEPLLEYREVAPRSAAEAHRTLLAGGGDPHHWRKVRLFADLWRMAGDRGLPRRTRWSVRREIVLAIGTTKFFDHLEEDLQLRLMSAEHGHRIRHRVLARILRVAMFGVKVRRSVAVRPRGRKSE